MQSLSDRRISFGDSLTHNCLYLLHCRQPAKDITVKGKSGHPKADQSPAQQEFLLSPFELDLWEKRIFWGEADPAHPSTASEQEDDDAEILEDRGKLSLQKILAV